MDHLTGQRTIVSCYLSIAEWSVTRSDGPSLLVKHPQERLDTLIDSRNESSLLISHQMAAVHQPAGRHVSVIVPMDAGWWLSCYDSVITYPHRRGIRFVLHGLSDRSLMPGHLGQTLVSDITFYCRPDVVGSLDSRASRSICLFGLYGAAPIVIKRYLSLQNFKMPEFKNISSLNGL